jgi:uncharacterized protein (DUF488 family)
MTNAIRAYSLGYEGISLDRYVEILKENEITAVVDVRETPWSHKRGFSKKPLSERLEAEGIFYLHVKSAGNPSRNRKMGLPQHSVIELYKEHLDANPSCLDQIYNLIKSLPGAVCLLCFEREPSDCHRKVILDRIVQKRSRNVMSCHLYGHTQPLEEPNAAQRIPQSNDRERAGVHMKVAEDERRLVAI